MEILATLGINWQLLLAQVINFAIVLLLLTKFVYKPLLKAIDDRRETIRKSMEDVQDINQQKQLMEEKRQELLTKADQEAGAILEKAKAEADAMRAEIINTAQKQAEQIIAKGEKQLQDERARVFHEVQDVMVSSIIKLSEQIIRREFSKKDQERLMKNLKEELPALLNV